MKIVSVTTVLLLGVAFLASTAEGHKFWLEITNEEEGQYEITFSEKPFLPGPTIGKLKDVIEKSLTLTAVLWEKSNDSHYGERKEIQLQDWKLENDRIVGSIPQEVLKKGPTIKGFVDHGPYRPEVDADDILFYFSSAQLKKHHSYHGHHHYHDHHPYSDNKAEGVLRYHDHHPYSDNKAEGVLRVGNLRTPHWHSKFTHGDWKKKSNDWKKKSSDGSHQPSFSVMMGSCGGKDVVLGAFGILDAGSEECLVDDQVEICVQGSGGEKLGCQKLDVKVDEKSGHSMAFGKMDLSELVVSPTTLFVTSKITVAKKKSVETTNEKDNDTLKILKVSSSSVNYSPACPDDSVVEDK